MTTSVTIAARFNGPPDSANGGYASGVVARAIHGAAEITLRSPPPLDTELSLLARDDGSVVLQHDALLIAEGRPSDFTLELPASVSLADAIDASSRYPGVTFPHCFVCGSARANDGGLMILPGALRDRRMVAAPWTPTMDLADENGVVDAVYAWSALDCPSWFAHAAFTAPEDLNVALLGRMSARVERLPAAGDTCVVVGWPIKHEGRRIYAGSALFDETGNPLAWSSTIWIELK